MCVYVQFPSLGQSLSCEGLLIRSHPLSLFTANCDLSMICKTGWFFDYCAAQDSFVNFEHWKLIVENSSRCTFCWIICIYGALPTETHAHSQRLSCKGIRRSNNYFRLPADGSAASTNGRNFKHKKFGRKEVIKIIIGLPLWVFLFIKITSNWLRCPDRRWEESGVGGSLKALYLSWIW